jgi:2-methylcitrate dehydratase
VYIVATSLRKAIERAAAGEPIGAGDEAWKSLMLLPHDYSDRAIMDPRTRELMQRITFEHGGPEYDAKYPDGIPTSVVITDAACKTYDSGLVMYPAGHARNTTADLRDILQTKFIRLGELASEAPKKVIERFDNLSSKNAEDVAPLYDFEIVDRGRFE